MQRRERIPPGRDFLMKLVAAGFDVIGALANLVGIGGTIVGIFGNLSFMMWYLIIGGGLIRPKNIKRAGLSAIIELIPIINILPGYSLFVWRQNRAIKKEDEDWNKANEVKIKAEEERRRKTAQLAEAERQERLRSETETSRKVVIDESGNPVWNEVEKTPEEIGEEKKQKDEETQAQIEEIKKNPIKSDDLPNNPTNTLGSARPSRGMGEVEYENREDALTKRDHGYIQARKRPYSPTSSTESRRVDGIKSSNVIGSAPVLRSEGEVSFDEAKKLGGGGGVAYSPRPASSKESGTTSSSSYSHTVKSSIPGYMEKRDSSETMKKIKRFYGERSTITPKNIEDARRRFKDDPDVMSYLSINPNDSDVADQINMI